MKLPLHIAKLLPGLAMTMLLPFSCLPTLIYEQSGIIFFDRGDFRCLEQIAEDDFIATSTHKLYEATWTTSILIPPIQSFFLR